MGHSPQPPPERAESCDGQALVCSQQPDSCVLFSLVVLFLRQGLLLFLGKGEKKAAGEILSDDRILGGY